jgi:hypothetical protein
VNVGPFPTASVIDRLKQIATLRHVDGAAGLSAAEKQQPPAYPAAYVFADERADAPKGYSGGILHQEVHVTLVVVLYVAHAGSAASGAKAQAALDSLRGEVRAALVNWKAPGQQTVLHLIASDGTSYQAGSQQGQEAFGTRYSIRTGANP